MAAYGQSLYGTSTYGYTTPPQYRVDPFVADPVDYSSISISWTKPTGTILAWRLIKNMQGYPVDQDDGVVLVDSSSGYPGNSYTDTSVVPGAYHYYGFYVLVNSTTDLWVRCSVTACLMINNYSSALKMLQLIPNFYIQAAQGTDELASDPTGNPYLNSFMSVFGWGLDYIRTQYDTYLNFNNALTIPLNDLYNLAEELGIDINPDIHPYTLRKAVYYNAIINKSKGTLNGIQAEISALTGWFADLTIGPNLMLDNDQSFFEDPVYPAWSPDITYAVNEIVRYGNYNYICISTSNYGHAPTGTSSGNTWWDAVLNTSVSTLNNSVTGGVSTWEGIFVSQPNTVLPSGGLVETSGIVDPINTSVLAFNGLTIKNTLSGTTDMWIRSVSRTTAEIPTANYPDSAHAIGDGIPIPYYLFYYEWNEDTTYAPQDIVIYSNQPFIALRASQNSVPPYATPGSSNEDWAPLGFDERFRFAISSYIEGTALEAIPFIEWYDSSGNFITRVFAVSTGNVLSLPTGVCYASFVTGAGSTLATYPNTDDGSYEWATQTGGFSISPYAGGCVYPTTIDTRSIVTTNTGSANCQVGLTFPTNPNSGWSTGLVLRYGSSTSYLKADMTNLWENNGGTVTSLGTYSTPCSPGDRILIVLNSTSITVYRNGSSVLTVTSAFNDTDTTFGIIYEET